MEIDVLKHLFGPAGGLFAVGIGIGASGGWAFCQRSIVALHVKRLSEMRDDFQRQDDECKSRVNFLEQRVRELEDDRFNRAVKD